MQLLENRDLFYKKQNLPNLSIGDTVRVTNYLELPKEADSDGKKEKERIQAYEGVIIAKHLNSNQKQEKHLFLFSSLFLSRHFSYSNIR